MNGNLNRIGRMMDRANPKTVMKNVNERVVKRIVVIVVLRRSMKVKGHLLLDCRTHH